MTTLPSDTETLARAADLIALQRRSFSAAGPPSLAARRDRLRRLEAMLRVWERRLISAITDDFGNRARQETELAEIVPVLSAIRHAHSRLPHWMRHERRRVALPFLPGRAWIEFDPLGVIGVVSPWNYPLFLSLSPLVDAVAGGNRVMLKPSELTPACSACLAEALADSFDLAEVAVLTGGPKIASAFCRLGFDHLLFTGSNTTGAKVMQAAAETLTPVTLELGGKSPAVITSTASLSSAAMAIAQTKFFNAGQSCLAPDYVLVPRSNAAKFAPLALAAAESLYPRIIENPDYTSVIDDRAVARLDDWVAEAARDGATILRHAAPGSGRRYAPVVVLDPPTTCRLMREEIFGPVLPIIGYDSLDEALAFIAERPSPLGLYSFTGSPEEDAVILRATRSGGVTIGAAMLHCLQEDLPFGGLGASGFGAYHGEAGFRRFTHARAIYRPGRFNQTGRLAAPYGRFSAMLLHWLKGRPSREIAAIAKAMDARSERS